MNGRLVLEGPLRVHWGVSKPIQLKEKDEVAPKDSREWRQSYCRALANGLDESFLQVGSHALENVFFILLIIINFEMSFLSFDMRFLNVSQTLRFDTQVNGIKMCFC